MKTNIHSCISGDLEREGPRSTMKSCWQVGADHLICTWSEAEVRVPYNPRWMQDTSQVVSQGQSISVPPDFRRFSLLGGSRWLEARRGKSHSPHVSV